MKMSAVTVQSGIIDRTPYKCFFFLCFTGFSFSITQESLYTGFSVLWFKRLGEIRKNQW